MALGNFLMSNLCLTFSIYKEEMIVSTSQDYCVDLDNEAIIKGDYKSWHHSEY